MAYRYHGRAGATNPASLFGSSWSECQRCGFNFQHRDLQWQFEYAGKTMLNKRLLVCRTCLDAPAPFLQAITLPPDPLPILDARPHSPAPADYLWDFSFTTATFDSTFYTMDSD